MGKGRVTEAGPETHSREAVGRNAGCRVCAVGVVEGLQSCGPAEPEGAEGAEDDEGEGVADEELEG